jgi:dipeptidyl aminopeptidase/acylaminoacyl peptidase
MPHMPTRSRTRKAAAGAAGKRIEAVARRAGAGVGSAVKTRPITARDLLRFQFLSDPRLSPDGRAVVFVNKQVGEKNEYRTNLWLADTRGGPPRQFTGGGRDSQPRWSPDGRRIAFVGGREKARPQLYLIPAAGGEALPLTRLPEGSIGSFRWSPDGKLIALTFRARDPDWTEEAKKARQDKGLSDPPRVLDDWWYRLDGDGYFNAQRYHLHLVDATTGKHRLLYDRHVMGVTSFDFSPDSRRIAVISNRDPQAMAHPWKDQILRIDLADGNAVRIPHLPEGPKDQVRWSPDGKRLAWAGCIGQVSLSDTGNVELFVGDAEKGGAKSLTGAEDYCLCTATLSDTSDASFDATLFWAPDSRRIWTNLGWHGEAHLASVGLDGGSVTFHTTGERLHALSDVSRNGKLMAMIVGSPTRLAEIHLGELVGKELRVRAITDLNGPVLRELELVAPEMQWVTGPDGARVQVWSMKPKLSAGERAPAILEIHGGPHAQYGAGFFHEFQLLVAQGYAVFFANPRGSKGYGRDFCSAIRGNWGVADWQDIEAVTTFIKRRGYVDPKRLGVMGGSYGGYMVNWAVAHTDAFKAAITDRCVSNLVSMLGSSDLIDEPGIYWPGNSWDQPEELWRMSPLKDFGRVKTPMLIIHSEGDLRCNIEQAEQVFTALNLLGVPCRFVRYPASTSHGMSRIGPPDMRLHRLDQVLRWWKKHLGG